MAPEGMDSDDHRIESGEDGINVVLFADTDVLTDRLWVQKQNFLGQTIVNSFADNGTLVANLADQLLGSSDLIGIRTRISTSRPFDRVDELRLSAEAQFRDTEERLQAELEETERRLTELQAAQGGGDLMVVTPEQEEEIQRFMDRRLDIRRELRQVQHDLRRDIDRLDARIKFINIVLVPAAVMLVALLYAVRRRRLQAATFEKSGGGEA